MEKMKLKLISEHKLINIIIIKSDEFDIKFNLFKEYKNDDILNILKLCQDYFIDIFKNFGYYIIELKYYRIFFYNNYIGTTFIVITTKGYFKSKAYFLIQDLIEYEFDTVNKYKNTILRDIIRKFKKKHFFEKKVLFNTIYKDNQIHFINLNIYNKHNIKISNLIRSGLEEFYKKKKKSKKSKILLIFTYFIVFLLLFVTPIVLIMIFT